MEHSDVIVRWNSQMEQSDGTALSISRMEQKDWNTRMN